MNIGIDGRHELNHPKIKDRDQFRKVNYFPMFGSVMKNKLENTFQCLVMLWKISWKITY